jgi:hypothetical protein
VHRWLAETLRWSFEALVEDPSLFSGPAPIAGLSAICASCDGFFKIGSDGLFSASLNKRDELVGG